MLKRKGTFIAAALLTALVLTGLTLEPEAAAGSAREGIELCLTTILPSLFPFMAAGGLITGLGLTDGLSKLLSPLMSRLFGVSGRGCGAFILGLTGGYPLGAVTAAQLYKNGEITKTEAERLLGFCDNTGPAFIIGVAGGAVFQSAGAGLFLYAVHIAAAVLTGILLRTGRGFEGGTGISRAGSSLPAALSAAVKRSVSVCGAVCGFVVFFSVLLGLLSESGILPALVLGISRRTGLELSFVNALLTGIFELGSGIGSMRGLPACAESLSLCAFILGFGGLSVHAQSFSAIAEGGLDAAKHLLGKLLHGVLSALLSLLAYPLVF